MHEIIKSEINVTFTWSITFNRNTELSSIRNKYSIKENCKISEIKYVMDILRKQQNEKHTSVQYSN